MTDMHLHTRVSSDSEEAPENYIKAALAARESYLGFSEHYDFDEFLDEGGCYLPDLPAYLGAVEELQKCGVRVLKGLEFGYRKQAVERYKEILSGYPLDYCILSVHTLQGRGDCYFPRFFSGWSKREAYKNYLSAVLESVNCGLEYSVVGHIGYVARNSTYDDKRLIYAEFPNLIDDILKSIIARGVCLEINASVGVSGNAFTPDKDIIERYLGLGGKYLSYGSDAHTADKYLRRAGEVKKYLLSLGVDTLYRVENRKNIPEKL